MLSHCYLTLKNRRFCLIMEHNIRHMNAVISSETKNLELRFSFLPNRLNVLTESKMKITIVAKESINIVFCFGLLDQKEETLFTLYLFIFQRDSVAAITLIGGRHFNGF